MAPSLQIIRETLATMIAYKEPQVKVRLINTESDYATSIELPDNFATTFAILIDRAQLLGGLAEKIADGDFSASNLEEWEVGHVLHMMRSVASEAKELKAFFEEPNNEA